MFTAASDSTGWVSFLCKVLERWIGMNFYDEIIHQEMIDEWHLFNKSDCRNKIGYIKNMNMIREIINFKYKHNTDHFEIIAIDDRPQNIVNGISIGVSPYFVAMNMFEVIKYFMPTKHPYLMSRYKKQIEGCWERYLENPSIYIKSSIDSEFYYKLEHIEKLIIK